ncbi:discoidin domain-containing protein [Paenibacillus spongiae]|uniref:Discoidin domain-containing protein n=1 Tax=Paenibacillus spongiae TaxID=2909671 RepID=A0ABY5SLB0_9BACL|nr:discoidin domain-containing protein [Paenibacillus spongiae]UVI33363.1 discoidin domain-containing protein [Paenibacillus spongiae]
MYNKLKVLSFLAMVFIVILPGMSLAAGTGEAEGGNKDLKVMSYNLRYASSSGSNSWEVRRPVMAQLLNKEKPDIMGIQEGLYHQLKDLHADMPQYDWIGIGRQGGSRDEYTAVFYNKNKFTPLEYDYFWLSDTPNVIGSKTWGNQITRMVTWVKFEDVKTKQQFYFMNTHFDHISVPARENSAELIVQKMNALDPLLPVILTGDFNVAPNTKPYQTLINEGKFADTWVEAETRINENLGTFNGFQDPTGGANRIDWILVKGNISVKEAAINNYTKNGQYPSDHYPVIATMVIEPHEPSLAIGKPATGSQACAASEGPEKAFDGVTIQNSKFCTKTPAKWLQVDLGSSYEVSKFIIYHAGFGGESPSMNTKDFNILISEDGSTWSTAVQALGNTANVTTHAISPVKARYVKLEVTNSGSDEAARIYEVGVYGK